MIPFADINTNEERVHGQHLRFSFGFEGFPADSEHNLVSQTSLTFTSQPAQSCLSEKAGCSLSITGLESQGGNELTRQIFTMEVYPIRN